MPMERGFVTIKVPWVPSQGLQRRRWRAAKGGGGGGGGGGKEEDAVGGNGGLTGVGSSSNGAGEGKPGRKAAEKAADKTAEKAAEKARTKRKHARGCHGQVLSEVVIALATLAQDKAWRWRLLDVVSGKPASIPSLLTSAAGAGAGA
eukprot:CAMPEP_0197586212 /NCGR_PEP_ID=MMETSP1326-20131121/8260_1 /TAXON_ID=1155430 /ORGANISM="Genus nov. species nov., Strain RCC2288" /LENGTH=146 /DNA_ID=CAMNT_0043150809 /DNA_START=304 /DNA_END=742 /DNA_ORIENTATION=-